MKIDILVNVAGGSIGEFILEREKVGKFADSTSDKWYRITGCQSEWSPSLYTSGD